MRSRLQLSRYQRLKFRFKQTKYSVAELDKNEMLFVKISTKIRKKNSAYKSLEKIFVRHVPHASKK